MRGALFAVGVAWLPLDAFAPPAVIRAALEDSPDAMLIIDRSTPASAHQVCARGWPAR